MTLRAATACLLLALPTVASPAAEKPAASAPAAVVTPPVPTVIESGSADAISSATETTFTFRNKVTVTATNLKLTCDELVVVAKRSGDPQATLGKQENFKSLIATGNVRILQGDRESLCARAEVYPGEDRVELTGNPVVRSPKEGWEQTGHKMILYRGQRRAVVEGTATERTRLVLPALKDLGDLGQDDKKKQPPDTPAPGATTPAQTPPPAQVPPTVTVPLPTPPQK